VKAEYATGKSTVHDKLDSFGRPVLIIRANKHNPSEWLVTAAAALQQLAAADRPPADPLVYILCMIL
jgi:hypothetical protein